MWLGALFVRDWHQIVAVLMSVQDEGRLHDVWNGGVSPDAVAWEIMTA